MHQLGKNRFSRYLLIIFGGVLFAVGTNLFVVPVGLYSGGIIGALQVVRTLIVDAFSLNLPPGLDIAGMLFFIVNIPLLYLTFRFISRSFFYATIASVITQTVFFMLIPISSAPIVDDTLASCVIGGVITGCGIGLTLRSSGSGGGTDILAILLSKKYRNFSVGKFTIIFNTVLYLVCAFAFDARTALYSILYVSVFSVVVDKIHLQNISVSAMVFTKKKDIDKLIIAKLGRGVTKWNGFGGYTDENLEVLVVVISKYEVSSFRELIFSVDPGAFITFNEGLTVYGNFEKKF